MPHQTSTKRVPLSPALLRLQADARSSRERFQLYKARVHGPQPTEPVLLAELERICMRAESQFKQALAERDAGSA
jgi:hypothetical protein